MPLPTRPYDSAYYLDDEESIIAYLEEAIEADDPALFAEALGVVARAKGMSQIARDAGMSRESLYRALSPTGNPEFGTVMKVVRALGLRVSVRPAASLDEPAARA